MKRSHLAVLMLALSVSAAGQNRPSSASHADARSDGKLVAREPYRFPFSTRAAWLDSWRERPNGTAAATTFADLVSEVGYAGWAGGKPTTTSRITYRSGGLAIRGLMIESRAPGRIR